MNILYCTNCESEMDEAFCGHILGDTIWSEYEKAIVGQVTLMCWECNYPILSKFIKCGQSGLDRLINEIDEITGGSDE